MTSVPSQEVTGSIAQQPASERDIKIEDVIANRMPQSSTGGEVLAWAGTVPNSPAFSGPVAASRDIAANVAPQVAAIPQTQVMPQVRPSEAAPAVAAQPAVMRAPYRRMKIYGHRFGDAKPINFGSASPRKHAVHGVDVSRWQGNLDWVTLRTQGANFVYIKATDGGDHLDPMFRNNWKAAKEAGMKRGAYHFFYWCRVASDQADWFIRNVPRDPEALPPVIDVEWNGDSSCKRRPSPAQVREKMQVFMDRLEKHYGKRPVIYTAPDFYKDNLQGAFTDYPFWLRSVAAHPSKVYPGRKWLFWQYSGSGLSQGVNGRIDLNVFSGNEDQWHKWLSKNAT